MAIEIERKYLVLGQKWREFVTHSISMRQAYLGGNACSIRVRIEGELAKLNIKSKEKGAIRQEYEYQIPLADALEILSGLAGEKVCKTRHFIPHQGLIIEVDEFEFDNEGLIIAEIELSHVEQKFTKPRWLGIELTNSHRYYNTELARLPFAAWPDRLQILQEMATC